MADVPNCLRCSTPMEAGFMVDKSYGAVFQMRWCRGTPQPSFWSGEVRPRQITAASLVTTMRCPKCGYLESYALDTPSNL